VPATSATTQWRNGGRVPDASTHAQAYARVIRGANATSTTMRPSTGRSTASRSATAMGSPSASDGQKRRP
jgi:hypothetical protein